MKKTILITNDDGIGGKGLEPLIKELKKIGTVIVIVPSHDRSAVSHSITLKKPLHVKSVKKQVFVTDGTPADCVRFGTLYLCMGKVDLVVSGINTGPNLGQDVIYSGTVAGAREGALLGVPSFSISVADAKKPNYPESAKFARTLSQKILKNEFPKFAYLNVNVPNKIKGVRVVSLGNRIYDDEIECRVDPRGEKYYWLAGKSVSGLHQAGMDITAVEKGFISVTPLMLTPTATELFGKVKKILKI